MHFDECMDLVDWNGGMEWWNGLDWNGMKWPEEQVCGRVRPLTLNFAPWDRLKAA